MMMITKVEAAQVALLVNSLTEQGWSPSAIPGFWSFRNAAGQSLSFRPGELTLSQPDGDFSLRFQRVSFTNPGITNSNGDGLLVAATTSEVERVRVLAPLPMMWAAFEIVLPDIKSHPVYAASSRVIAAWKNNEPMSQVFELLESSLGAKVGWYRVNRPFWKQALLKSLESHGFSSASPESAGAFYRSRGLADEAVGFTDAGIAFTQHRNTVYYVPGTPCCGAPQVDLNVMESFKTKVSFKLPAGVLLAVLKRWSTPPEDAVFRAAAEILLSAWRTNQPLTSSLDALELFLGN